MASSSIALRFLTTVGEPLHEHPRKSSDSTQKTTVSIVPGSGTHDSSPPPTYSDTYTDDGGGRGKGKSKKVDEWQVSTHAADTETVYLVGTPGPSNHGHGHRHEGTGTGTGTPTAASRRNSSEGNSSKLTDVQREVVVDESDEVALVRADGQDPEFKLPDLASLLIVILGNMLCQVNFFVIVSSASAYAEHLGGTATFSGLAIGIPTVFAALSLIPMVRYDQGYYKRALLISYAALTVGNILYALAYLTNFLYLILIGRIVTGVGFTSFLYTKRYCSDPRLVGIRRRTTLASCLVVGQGVGSSLGPFVGGLLFRIGFAGKVWNGYTSPAWVMAVAWVAFALVALWKFRDVQGPALKSVGPSFSSRSPMGSSSPDPSGGAELPRRSAYELAAVPKPGDALLSSRAHASKATTVIAEAATTSAIAVTPLPLPSPATATSPAQHVKQPQDDSLRSISFRQWGVIITMMWYAMTCFFVLGAWESNIPVYTALSPRFHYTPYNAGNFIALGGVTAFPFLMLNVWYSRRLQDRVILALGSLLGTAGIVAMLGMVYDDRVRFAGYYVAWSLVALGFNLASTCTLSLLSKQLPGSWNGWISLVIQCSNYTGRVTGAVWGGAGVAVGMDKYLWLQLAYVMLGMVLHMTLWRELKAKTG